MHTVALLIDVYRKKKKIKKNISLLSRQCKHRPVSNTKGYGEYKGEWRGGGLALAGTSEGLPDNGVSLRKSRGIPLNLYY